MDKPDRLVKILFIAQQLQYWLAEQNSGSGMESDARAAIDFVDELIQEEKEKGE